MDVIVIGKAIGALGLLGIVGGAVVSGATRRLPLESDHRMERVLAELPGGNCGACGMPSCFATAAAIAGGRLPVDACVFGGRGVAEAVTRTLAGQECDQRLSMASLFGSDPMRRPRH